MLRCRRYSYDLIPAVDWLESDMTIAPTLQKHIEAHGVAFEIVEHDRTTYTSSETAHASHVSGDYIAKAVLLRDEQGGHLLAVLPATHHVHFGDLGRWLGRHLPLASEGEIKLVFEDCAMGAIPAIRWRLRSRRYCRRQPQRHRRSLLGRRRPSQGCVSKVVEI